MLKYLVVLLDDTSVSYCHFCNGNTENRLISLDDLKAGILFAMKENLMIQFVYPNYELPQDYKDVIYGIDHSKIVPMGYIEHGDVVVANCLEDLNVNSIDCNLTYVLRIKKDKLYDNHKSLSKILEKVARLNIVLTDIEDFTSEDFEHYKTFLQEMVGETIQLYISGKSPQLNILTDRMMLDSMNNCNAGWENITLAPNGCFYVCPAFYHSDNYCIGDLKNGLTIKNQQLYKLSYAPLCRNCDAYQCKRCVWLNLKTTCEINTPSHEQCVVAHLERNASKQMLANIRKFGTFLPEKEIKEINYLDPFDAYQI